MFHSPWFSLFRKPISLRYILVVPFVLLTAGSVTWVGILSYQSGQQAVTELAQQLMTKTSDRVSRELDHFLHSAHQMNRANIAALKSGVIRLDNLDQLHHYLILQHQQAETLTTILLGTPQGDFRAIHRVNRSQEPFQVTRLHQDELPYKAGISDPIKRSKLHLHSIDQSGNLRRSLKKIKDIDVRQRPWYQRAVASGKPGWSKPFQIGDSNVLSLSAYAPVFSPSHQLLAVFSVNVSLQQLNDFLTSLQVGKTGQIFIVDRSYLLVATSTGELSYTTTLKNYSGKSTTLGQLQFRRLAAMESANSTTQAAAHQLRQILNDEITQSVENMFRSRTSRTVEFEQEHDRFFLQVSPYQDGYGLEWLIVTVVPESDFMAKIHSNVHTTVYLCLLTLGVAIATSIVISRRIMRSLNRLSLSIIAVAMGDLIQPLPTSHIAEIEGLSISFRRMVKELQQADQLRRNYEQDLETEVAEKTAALLEAQRIAQVGSWELDVATGEGVWSPQLFQIMGLDPHQPPPRYPDVLRARPAESRERLREAIETAIADGTPYQVDYPIVRPDGTTRYLSSRGEAIVNPQGQVIKLRGTATDITERKHLENALRLAEAKTRSILNSAIAAITSLRVFPDHTWHIDQVSAGVERLSGYTSTELTQDNFLWISLIVPDDWQAIEAAIFADIFAERSGTYEYRLQHKDGSLRWISQTNNSRWDNMQQYWTVTVISVDITDRKQAELALRQSELKFATIFRDSPQPAWIATLAEGRCLDINDSFTRVLGYSQAEAIGLTCIEMQLWSDLADFEHFHESLFQYGKIDNLEVEFCTKAGELKTVLLFARVSRLDDQDRVLGVLSDITDRKQAELQVKAALVEKEILLQEVYHRVKNNLQLIRSLLSMQQRRINHPIAAQALQDSQERLMAISLVHEILYQSDDLSRIDLHDYVPTLIQHLTLSYRTVAPAVMVTTQSESIIVPMKQAICCGLILNELVSNALKYAFPKDEQGEVFVRLQQIQQTECNLITLIVEDRGMGLPKDINFSNPKTLGLSLVQDLVKQLRGTIALETSSGTCICITFGMNP